jgi:hypothetical protein
MAEAHPPGSPSGDPAGGYERSDLTAKSVAIFGVALAAVIILVLVVTGWMFHYFAAWQARVDVPPSPLAQTRPGPPEPRLQVDPTKDLKAMHAEEDTRLTGYGWVDKEAGVVRMPIARAMELLVERRLPAAAKKAPAREGRR